MRSDIAGDDSVAAPHHPNRMKPESFLGKSFGSQFGLSWANTKRDA